MRVIAGKAKGCKLKSVPGKSTRPITDRAKTALFNILGNDVIGSRFLDLFAGTGGVGIEALSRGAKFATFVEKDPRIIAVLKKNIEKARFVKESKVIKANAFAIGAPVILNESRYNLVFVDPPYAATMNAGEDSALAGLMDILNDQITNDGIVIVRTSHEVSLLERYGPFQIEERRLWGTMAVTILTKTECDIRHTQDDIRNNDQ